jgi:dolichol-phosphate mannosyltransferase
MLSVVIPAHNEEESLETTILGITKALNREGIPHEIVVVNDYSKDATPAIIDALGGRFSVRRVDNKRSGGFGHAVISGLEASKGEYVAIMMADASDSPADLVLYYRRAEETGSDCVFGSRFIRGGSTHDYPRFKLVLNRLFNSMVQLLFGIRYNDCTNAFKLYRRTTLEGLRPFMSPHFNLTLELPLKAIVRGYSYEVIPNSWHNRKQGVSKLKIKEMGSRYLFIVFYCLIERYFSRGDFKKK